MVGYSWSKQLGTLAYRLTWRSIDLIGPHIGIQRQRKSTNNAFLMIRRAVQHLSHAQQNTIFGGTISFLDRSRSSISSWVLRRFTIECCTKLIGSEECPTLVYGMRVANHWKILCPPPLPPHYSLSEVEITLESRSDVLTHLFHTDTEYATRSITEISFLWGIPFAWEKKVASPHPEIV